LIQVKDQEKTTESGIVLPETSEGDKPQQGKVVSVGDSKKINPKVKKGVDILFAKFSGSEVEVGDEEFLILKAEDILAVLE